MNKFFFDVEPEIIKQISNLNDKLRNNESIVVNGRACKLGMGDKYCCSISAAEMEKGITKICFNPEHTYYVICPEYYNRITNQKKFEYIGQFKSKLKDKDNLVDFGFGKSGSGVTRHEF